jgi:hypothetical protein
MSRHFRGQIALLTLFIEARVKLQIQIMQRSSHYVMLTWQHLVAASSQLLTTYICRKETP